MKHLLTSIFFLAFSLTTFAQVDEYSEEVKKCINSNRTVAYYETVVDEMFGMLKDQYASQNVPDDVWNELESLKPNAISELSQMIVSAYRGHFSLKDVKNMNNLYENTHAGQTMFVSPKDLTDDDRKVLDEFYKSKTGQKIIGSQDSMNKSLSQISEIWSSDLYKMVVGKLEEKGFKM